MNHTPENIKKLRKNEVFVFGSNLAGKHLGGAARTAKDLFGAVTGVGEGLTGKSYAFPTLDKSLRKRTKKQLEMSRNKLFFCADENPQKVFLVTKIGCGIAGFKEEVMKELFGPETPSNIILPEGWDQRAEVKTLWKFLRVGLKSEYGKCEWQIGTWKKESGLSICNRGFHGSERIIDALSYVKGEVLALTEVRGESVVQADKQCWSEMRVVKAYEWPKEESVKLAIFSAELVIDIYEKQYPNDDRPRKAIEAAKAYLKDPSDAAAYAANAAAYGAYAANAAAYAANAAANAANAAAYGAAYAANAAANAANAAAYGANAAANAANAANAAILEKIEIYLRSRVKELKEIKKTRA